MKRETFIVSIHVEYYNARKLCEELENSVYTSPPDYEGQGDWYIEDMITREFPNVDRKYISVLGISDFMDEVNNGTSLDSVFITYVLYNQEIN